MSFLLVRDKGEISRNAIPCFLTYYCLLSISKYIFLYITFEAILNIANIQKDALDDILLQNDQNSLYSYIVLYIII